MTRLLPVALALVATPALAHPGAHLHPHGGESWLIIALALALATVATILIARRK
ncbi:peptidase M23 [Rhodobacterales bacterium HKCCE4037]|nr:peptidase M23 [Rhodobacterales bacterium HKCCE4037]